MKTLVTTACFVIGAALSPVPGYAAGYAADTGKERSSASEFVKDSLITAKIKAEMAKDREVSAMRIKVDTDRNGVVQLSGYAGSQTEAAKAVAIAQSVEGVVSVKNDIKIEPSKSPSGGY